MAKDNAYYPSLKLGKRYFQYLRYLIEYARHKDWKSIVSSLRFVATGQPERERRIVNSRLGRFVIRKGTTDFQFINYAYEHKIRDYLANNLNHFDLFLDVGACIGEYCVWLASMGKQVVAFEPVPANYIALRENASLNNAVDMIEALPFGLGAKEEEVHFEIMNVVTGSSHIDRDQTNGVR